DTLNPFFDGLAKRQLPPSTKVMFPQPVIIHLEKMEVGLPSAQLIIYDTGGEAFDRVESLGKFARYITQSECAIWIISWTELDTSEAGDAEPAVRAAKLANLITQYTQTISETGGDSSRQRLVVTFTMGDLLLVGNSNMPAFMRNALTDGWGDRVDYRRLERLSREMRKWLRENGCDHFVRLVEEAFGTVKYTIISATGGPTKGFTLLKDLAPKNVLSPLAWVARLEKGRRTRSALSEVALSVMEGSLYSALAMVLVAYLIAAAKGLASPSIVSLLSPSIVGAIFGAGIWGVLAANEAKAHSLDVGGLNGQGAVPSTTLRLRARTALVFITLVATPLGALVWHFGASFPLTASLPAASHFRLPGAYGLLLGLLLSSLLSPIWACLGMVRLRSEYGGFRTTVVLSIAVGAIAGLLSERLTGSLTGFPTWALVSSLLLWLTRSR
ncbi:MAG: hypothetical protein WCL39_13280, partial [Armatimonadota bacterium]